MPEGVLVTDPAPAPAGVMVNRKVGAKVAVTVVAAETVATEVRVPVQPPPLQPMKAEPAAGFAVRVTTVPLTKLAEQLAPQAMPAGLLVTVPEAAPAVATVSTKVGVKVAVTVVAAASVTTQLPVPLHPPPLQPVNAELAPGVAVSVTTVPFTRVAAQVAPQSMPAGLLVTVPDPAPPGVTARVTIGANVAVTVVAADMVTVHVAVLLQPPLDQPLKAEPASGAAVSVTSSSPTKLAVQVAPQSIPEGLLHTRPAPTVNTVSAKSGSKVAVIDVVANTVTLQCQGSIHPAPLQPAKMEASLGTAVRVTTVPIGKPEEHKPGQLMPVGVLVTVPAPEPTIVTKTGEVAEPAVTPFVAALTSSMSAPISVPSVAAWWKGLEIDR